MLAPPPRLTRLSSSQPPTPAISPGTNWLAARPEQCRAHQGGRLVDGPEQPALRIVEPARDGVARGIVHDPPSDDRRADQAGNDSGGPHGRRGRPV